MKLSRLAAFLSLTTTSMSRIDKERQPLRLSVELNEAMVGKPRELIQLAENITALVQRVGVAVSEETSGEDHWFVRGVAREFRPERQQHYRNKWETEKKTKGAFEYNDEDEVEDPVMVLAQHDEDQRKAYTSNPHDTVLDTIEALADHVLDEAKILIELVVEGRKRIHTFSRLDFDEIQSFSLAVKHLGTILTDVALAIESLADESSDDVDPETLPAALERLSFSLSLLVRSFVDVIFNFMRKRNPTNPGWVDLDNELRRLWRTILKRQRLLNLKLGGERYFGLSEKHNAIYEPEARGPIQTEVPYFFSPDDVGF